MSGLAEYHVRVIPVHGNPYFYGHYGAGEKAKEYAHEAAKRALEASDALAVEVVRSDIVRTDTIEQRYERKTEEQHGESR